MTISPRSFLAVCAILTMIAAARVAEDSSRVTTTKTTSEHGVTAQLVTTNDALPPTEGYDKSYTARVRISTAGKTAIDEVLTPAKGAFLTIDGPHIDSVGGRARVTLDATGSDDAVTRYVFTQGADGAFAERRAARPARAILPETTYIVERSVSKGAISVLVLANETEQLSTPPTLTIVRNGVPRNYATALPGNGANLAALDGPSIVDIDGTGEPALIFSAMSSGASCCVTTELFVFDATAGKYRRFDHDWSFYKNAPSLVRFPNEKIVTFAARDIGFSEAAGAITAYNGIAPVQLWQFRKHAFVDVTRAYPASIRADAKDAVDEIATAKGQGDAPALEAACARYVADERLLGRRAAEGEIFRTVCKTVPAADRAVIDKALEAKAYTKNV